MAFFQSLQTELTTLKQEASNSSHGAHAQVLEIEKQLLEKTQQLEDARKQLHDKEQESHVSCADVMLCLCVYASHVVDAVV